MAFDATVAEALIRRYFDGCNAADIDQMAACFTEDAAHYFPPGLPDIPWRGARTIGEMWRWCVVQLGSQWTIEKVLVGPDAAEVAIEWTHRKTGVGEVLRGNEWYVFDTERGLIRETRAHYAAPAGNSLPINELLGFDYRGRGYALEPNPIAPTFEQ